MDKSKVLKLESHQIKCYEKSVALASSHFSSINTAPPGSGKSYIGMAIGQTFKFKLFLVVPSNGDDQWEDYLKEYGMEAIIITYTTLRGRGTKVSHPYLTKTVKK